VKDALCRAEKAWASISHDNLSAGWHRLWAATRF
jgi:hypothetical protein